MSHICVVVFTEVFASSSEWCKKSCLKVGEFTLVDRTNENRLTRATIESIKVVCRQRASEYCQHTRDAGKFKDLVVCKDDTLCTELEVQSLMSPTDIAQQQWQDAEPAAFQANAKNFIVYVVLRS